MAAMVTESLAQIDVASSKETISIIFSCLSVPSSNVNPLIAGYFKQNTET